MRLPRYDPHAVLLISTVLWAWSVTAHSYVSTGTWIASVSGGSIGAAVATDGVRVFAPAVDFQFNGPFERWAPFIGPAGGGWLVNVPFWLVILITGVGAMIGGRLKLAKTLRLGLCPGCGFPTPAGAVCSECGTPTAQSARKRRNAWRRIVACSIAITALAGAVSVVASLCSPPAAPQPAPSDPIAAIQETRARGLAVSAAIQSYHAKHARYPAALSDLVPDALDAILEPTTSTRGWQYSTPIDGSGFTRIRRNKEQRHRSDQLDHGRRPTELEAVVRSPTADDLRVQP